MIYALDRQFVTFLSNKPIIFFFFLEKTSRLPQYVAKGRVRVMGQDYVRKFH